jgi:hypothetical protein
VVQHHRPRIVPNARSSDAPGVAKRPVSPHPSSPQHDRILELQAGFGNQAVVRHLHGSPPDAGPPVAQRSALDDNLTPTDRGKIQVLTIEHVSTLSAAEIKSRMIDAAEPKPPVDEVMFGTEVGAKVRRGLTHLAIEFGGNELRVNSIVNVALDLAPFGGVNGVYRFARVTRTATPKRLLIIDQVSAKPPPGPGSVDQAKEEKRFTKFGFSAGSGFGGDADRKELLVALARVPDAVLQHVFGLTFERKLESVGEKGEPGHYDPSTHTITFFGAAKKAMMGSADAGGADFFTFALAHEVGHAADFEPFALARKKRDRISRELADAQKRSRQVTIDPDVGIDAPNKPDEKAAANRAEVNRLRDALQKAQEELAKVQPDPDKPGGSHSQGAKFGAAKGEPISSYAKTGGKVEDFAELFALYILDPALLKSLRPDKYKYFADTFK